MSCWTYVTGVIEVDTCVRSDAEAMYLAQTVVNHPMVKSKSSIIMCCKGHCELEGAGKTFMEAIAAYMSKECACPRGGYKGQL